LAFVAAGFVIVSSHRARAADTVETWSVGATDVDFYVGYEARGRKSQNGVTYTDMMLGYGLSERLSAYLGTTLAGNGRLGAAEPSFYVGLFGTVVDTQHLDLDLFLDTATTQGPAGTLTVTPAVELNLDADAERQNVGLYLRLSAPFAGATDADAAPTAELAWNPGAYWTVHEGHQLLFEVVWANAREQAASFGGLSVGYNVALSEALELIHELHVNPGHDDEPTSVALMMGLIASLPAAR